MNNVTTLATLLIIQVFAVPAGAQSSSLYMQPASPPAAERSTDGRPQALPQQITAASFAAVRVPEPRHFAMQDLITIVVRESTQADSDSSLDTKKESKLAAQVSDWPGLRVFDLFTDQVLKTNLDEKPKLGINSSKQFKGEGDYSRSDTFVTRLTARIIDIKPNGNLVMEARKFIASDGESLEIVLTGTCRKDDVAMDNTVLSTQLYDLRLNKKHTGELRRASEKGVITRFFDLLFNF